MYVNAGVVNLVVSIVKVLQSNIVTSKVSVSCSPVVIVAVTVTVKVPASLGSDVEAIVIVLNESSIEIKAETGELVIV